MNEHFSNINETTQQNAQSSEETAVTSANLLQQSEDLKGLVSRFQLRMQPSAALGTMMDHSAPQEHALSISDLVVNADIPAPIQPTSPTGSEKPILTDQDFGRF